MTLQELIQIVNSPAGIAVLALLALWSIVKGIFVTGREHRAAMDREQAATQRERERGDEWRSIATGGLKLTDKALTKLEEER